MFFWSYMLFASLNVYFILDDPNTNQLLAHLMFFAFCIVRGWELSREDGIEI